MNKSKHMFCKMVFWSCMKRIARQNLGLVFWPSIACETHHRLQSVHSRCQFQPLVVGMNFLQLRSCKKLSCNDKGEHLLLVVASEVPVLSYSRQTSNIWLYRYRRMLRTQNNHQIVPRQAEIQNTKRYIYN